jgi:hypothetical protein
VLDPEALIPVNAIVARFEGVTAADVAKSVFLAEKALRVQRVTTDEEQSYLDALRDEMKAHESWVEAKLEGGIAVANRLHKALTGLRASAVARLPEAVKHAGNLLGLYLREKQEAEAERQRQEREKAVAQERARLKAEAEAARAEQLRLQIAAEAARTTDTAAADLLDRAAETERLAAEQATQEAATVTAPPIAAREIAAPTGSSTRANWQALPEHAEAWDEFPAGDKRALICFIAERLQVNDGSFIHLVDISKTACNQLAKAQKSAMKVPGIRAVNPPVYSKTNRG